MSEPAKKRPRVTPRNSEAQELVEATTPFIHLHELGRQINQPRNTSPQRRNLATTPIANLRRVQEVEQSGDASSSRDQRTTPASARNVGSAGAFSSSKPNTPATASRATPSGRLALRTTPRGRGAKPTTPHAIRAQLQLNQLRRYGGATPGKDRRRSGRTMRDTPRNELRALSRLMATTTAPIPPTPTEVPTSQIRHRSRAPSDSPDPAPPRLSLPRHELDYDSFHEVPPELTAGLEEDDVEEGRRMQLQRDRSSLGLRLSDPFDVVDAMGPDDGGDGYDVAQDDDDDDEAGLEGDYTGPLDDNTIRELRAQMQDEAEGDTTLGRVSPGTDGEQTFQFAIGGDRSRLSLFSAFDNTAADADEVENSALSDRQDATGFQDFGFEDMPQAEITEDQEVDDVEDDALDDDVDMDEEDVTTKDPTITSRTAANTTIATDGAAVRKERVPKAKMLHTSRLGIEYPSLPANVVKKLASTFCRQSGGNGKINKETVAALTEASDFFFEQLSEDVATFSTHARRKRIEEADVVTLMKRQRQLNDHNTVFSVAQKYLPGELLQAIRMPPVKSRGKKRKLSVIAEEE